MSSKVRKPKASKPERVYMDLSPQGALTALMSIDDKDLRGLDTVSLNLARTLLLNLEATCCYELRRRPRGSTVPNETVASNVVPFRPLTRLAVEARL